MPRRCNALRGRSIYLVRAEVVSVVIGMSVDYITNACPTRLLKETGRYSQSPVFVVGVFSGADQLGEGFGSSLKMAEYRVRTCSDFMITCSSYAHFLLTGGGGLIIETLPDTAATTLAAVADINIP